MRITAIPALPGAVESAYMVSPPSISVSLELEWRYHCWEGLRGRDRKMEVLEGDATKPSAEVLCEMTGTRRLYEKTFRPYNLAFGEAFWSIDSKSQRTIMWVARRKSIRLLQI